MIALRAVSALFIAMVGIGDAAVAADPRPPVTIAPARVDPKALAALGLSAPGTAAVRTLLDATIFGGWAVGAAAAPTPGVTALRIVMREPGAAAALAFIRAHATPAGQLMALAGLYDVDPAAFAAAIPAYLTITQRVRVWETGCKSPPDRAVADLVKAGGAVQTGGAGMPLPRWSPRHPGDSIIFDLAGGGYSAAMRERPKRP